MYSSCPSVCPSGVRLSVLSFRCPLRPISRDAFAFRISVLSEGISTKLPTNVQHMAKHC